MAKATKKAPAKKPAPRADYGEPIDGFFAKQPENLKPIADALRALVEAGAPAAEAALKWGMPFYTLAGKTYCAIGGHKAHVNLMLPGEPGTYDDPEALLEGEGKTGQHLKVMSLEELPRAQIKKWLKVAAANTRK